MTTVHIVGAGIAGLALASQLPARWDVHLHEAAWQEPTVPTLFALQAGGRRALERLGLLEEFRRRCVTVTGGMLADGQGRPLVRMSGVEITLLPRPELRDLLRSVLPHSVQVHRHSVHSVTGLHADLVVGADGVHSTVRRDFWGPASAARRLGATVIRGVIDADPVEGRFQEVWRPDGIFGITPRPGGGVNWFSTVPAQRFDSRAHALRHLRERWEGHAEDPQRVLAHATEAQTLVNDVWVSRWPRRLVRSVPLRGAERHAVLLGDAAHAMAPNLGRGANEVLIDAVALARFLREDGSLPRSLRRYETARMLSPQVMRVGSTLMHRLSATRRDRLRNALLSAVPARG